MKKENENVDDQVDVDKANAFAQESQDVLNLIMQVSNTNIQSDKLSLSSLFVDKLELAFMLSHYLSLSDLLCKVGQLDKQFNQTVMNL